MRPEVTELVLISSHWLCESLILEILMKLIFDNIFLILDVIHAHSFKSFENTGEKESRSYYLRDNHYKNSQCIYL